MMLDAKISKTRDENYTPVIISQLGIKVEINEKNKLNNCNT